LWRSEHTTHRLWTYYTIRLVSSSLPCPLCPLCPLTVSPLLLTFLPLLLSSSILPPPSKLPSAAQHSYFIYNFLNYIPGRFHILFNFTSSLRLLALTLSITRELLSFASSPLRFLDTGTLFQADSLRRVPTSLALCFGLLSAFSVLANTTRENCAGTTPTRYHTPAFIAS